MKNIILMMSIFLISTSCFSKQIESEAISSNSPKFGKLTVHAYLVSAVNACFTIHIVITLDNDVNTTVVYSGDVQVRNCGGVASAGGGNGNNDFCQGGKFKDDFILPSEHPNAQCLQDLIRDEFTYSQYYIATRRLINN